MIESPPTRPRTPRPDQLLLPFAEKDYVSVFRAASILGVSHGTVLDMYDAGLIEMINYAFGKRKRVRYRSLVDYCDGLRQKFSIAGRRPPLSAPYLRHRDADVLPFPMSDTISVKECCDILGYSSFTPVYQMIEEGRFEAYQVTPGLTCPWRISRSSLHAFLTKARLAAPAPDSRRSLSL